MSLTVRENVALAEFTTLQVGGAADYFVEVENEAELRQALRFAQQNATPVFVLGGGSNVLFPDSGYRGLVIKNSIRGVTVTEAATTVDVQVGAGEQWDSVVADMCQRGYWGIENLSAIPGTVGATPIQNVGAYGVEVADVITKVSALQVDTLQVKDFSVAECQFAYRDSFFKSVAGKRWAVLTVTLQLQKNGQPNLQYADLQPLQSQTALSPALVRDFVRAVRAQKFPDWSVVGTAGSFFKNPIVSATQYQHLKEQYAELPAHQTASGDWKLSLGWILDKVCGLKGYCVGAVCLYENQALVLTNTGSSATAVQTFVQQVTEKVMAATQIKIETEVLLVSAKND